jgi:CheY-like chemotaxis protein
MHSATVPVMERLPQTSATGNVLIVDAERAMREGCRDVAQAAGYNVLMAESGEQACKLLCKTRPSRGQRAVRENLTVLNQETRPISNNIARPQISP